jgi:hypothetical protein
LLRRNCDNCAESLNAKARRLDLCNTVFPFLLPLGGGESEEKVGAAKVLIFASVGKFVCVKFDLRRGENFLVRMFPVNFARLNYGPALAAGPPTPIKRNNEQKSENYQKFNLPRRSRNHKKRRGKG